MKLSLVVTAKGKAEGQVIPVTLSQFVIGRDPQCHLRPASPLISKRHCAILVKGGRVFLRDFGSTNGSFVNGKPVKGEVELGDGDQLTIGPLGFRVQVEASTPATKPTPPPPAKPKAAKAAEAPAGSGDDESIAAMLLSLGDEGGSSLPGPLDSDGIPQGSTVMDIPSALKEGETGQAEGKPDPKKKEQPKSSGNTSAAAKAILEKYTRRQRS